MTVRVLVTNDDGVDSPGLRALAEAVQAAGMEPVVAAPSWDTSGASASLTGVGENGRLAVERRSWSNWDRDVFAVEASPAMIVWVGLRRGFGVEPDLVVSGVNRGANTGLAVLHSGTVGAVLTGYNHGKPGMAVSLALVGSVTGRRGGSGGGEHWASATWVATTLLGWLAERDRPVVLNCNVPNLPVEKILGLRHARLASVGAVETTITDVEEGSIGVTFGAVEHEAAPDTDAGAVRAGYVSLSGLVPLSDAELDAVPSLPLP